MLESHQRFHSANGKRQILIADDELINRELLRAVLQDTYELHFATNGQEALDAMRKHRETLSLVLLDLLMPVMSGMELLRAARADATIAQIPVIVISGDIDSEIECLQAGAMDFIPKPYPKPGVILARVLRTIELSEDRDIISSTERDELTGLYNREYFYRYVEQFDLYHRDAPMDALVVDVNHFHMINERFGTSYGDLVLRQIAEALLTAVQPAEGLVCRREADTFLIYCPHGVDYDGILANASIRLTNGDRQGNRIWLRMGVYANVDKMLDVERRFDRAKRAADTVQGSFARRIGIYDDTMHERELYSEQLIENFDSAINEHQFSVFFQPKFDVQSEPPILASAEALVRWFHPTMGMINPGVFIPLFEENGLVQRLDLYVWRAAAAQIREWKERFGISIAVSVNVSRIDMYDPYLVETLQEVVRDNDIDPSELVLEITESAYTQDSQQIIETVNRLRDLGFRVEMDDFGTGYSSLNMISSLPIDALKLDMQFVRSAFSGTQDTRMLEVIIDIADYLSVPVIAEGVETEAQMLTLREMGCDVVQGFFFSRPVPPEEFERFILERKAVEARVREGDGNDARRGTHKQTAVTYGRIVQALAADYFGIYYVDIQTGAYAEYGAHHKYRSLGIDTTGTDFFADTKRNIERVVHPDDIEMLQAILTKDNIEDSLNRTGVFTVTYRIMFEDGPSYVHLKATRMVGGNDKHIVIGVSNVDEQIRREQERARAIRLANQDALTGVKSKLAYSQDERKLDRAIAAGEQGPFAVVVFDVNDLKYVNDTQGHAAGDQYLKDACTIICQTFKHSPVYRIGGDEFVAILRGTDYAARERLMAQLDVNNRTDVHGGGVSIAGGIAEFQKDTDQRLAAVFKRADTAMYENKRRLKGTSGSSIR